MQDTPLDALCGLDLLRFKITLNNIEIVYKALNIIIVPTVQFTSPWISENINNNKPGYIIIESTTFLTQAIQIQMSLLIFIFNVAERKSKVSRIFVPRQQHVLLLSPVVVACFVLFSLDCLLMVAAWCTFPWALCFLEQSEPLWSACVECLHFWEVFSHSALFVASATGCQLQSSYSLSSTSSLLSLNFLCNREEVLFFFFFNCNNHCHFNFPESQICSSLLPMGL